MSKRYITTPQLASRYQKTPRTIHRWIKNPPPGFPKPIVLNGRNLWPEDQIMEFEQKLASDSKVA